MVNQPLLNVGGAKITFKIGNQINEQVQSAERSQPSVPVIVRKPKEGRRERKIRSTSFNVADPLEQKLNAHADRFSCFSTYVKRLIHQDILSGNTAASTAPPEARYYDVMTSNLTAAPDGVK